MNRTPQLLAQRQRENRQAAEAADVLEVLRADLEEFAPNQQYEAIGYNELNDLVDLFLADHQLARKYMTDDMEQKLVILSQVGFK